MKKVYLLSLLSINIMINAQSIVESATNTTITKTQTAVNNTVNGYSNSAVNGAISTLEKSRLDAINTVFGNSDVGRFGGSIMNDVTSDITSDISDKVKTQVKSTIQSGLKSVPVIGGLLGGATGPDLVEIANTGIMADVNDNISNLNATLKTLTQLKIDEENYLWTTPDYLKKSPVLMELVDNETYIIEYVQFIYNYGTVNDKAIADDYRFKANNLADYAISLCSDNTMRMSEDQRVIGLNNLSIQMNYLLSNIKEVAGNIYSNYRNAQNKKADNEAYQNEKQRKIIIDYNP